MIALDREGWILTGFVVLFVAAVVVSGCGWVLVWRTRRRPDVGPVTLPPEEPEAPAPTPEEPPAEPTEPTEPEPAAEGPPPEEVAPVLPPGNPLR